MAGGFIGEILHINLWNILVWSKRDITIIYTATERKGKIIYYLLHPKVYILTMSTSIRMEWSIIFQKRGD